MQCPANLLLILAGPAGRTGKALSELRRKMGNRLGLRRKEDYKPLWVLDFPLFEYDAEENRWNASAPSIHFLEAEDEAFFENPIRQR